MINEAIRELHSIIDLEGHTKRRTQLMKWIMTHIHECSATSVIDHVALSRSHLDVEKFERERRFSVLAEMFHDAKGVAHEEQHPLGRMTEYKTTMWVLK